MKTIMAISHSHSGTRPSMEAQVFGLMMEMLYGIVAYIATAFESENDDKHTLQVVVTEREDGVRLGASFHLCKLARVFVPGKSGLEYEEVLARIEGAFVDGIVMEMVSGKVHIPRCASDIPSIASNIASELGLTRKA